MIRLIAVGALLHAKQLSRSPFEIAINLVVPIVQATLAVYLFRAGGQSPRLLDAAVGAGMMGVWSSVLFGSGGEGSCSPSAHMLLPTFNNVCRVLGARVDR